MYFCPYSYLQPERTIGHILWPMTHHSGDLWPAWPVPQSQTMAWVDHDYARISSRVDCCLLFSAMVYHPQKIIELGLAEMQFPAVLRGFVLAFFSIFIVDILTRSQFLLHPTPPSLFVCKFGQITRLIFPKSGVRTPDPSTSWLCQWMFFTVLTSLPTASITHWNSPTVYPWSSHQCHWITEVFMSFAFQPLSTPLTITS